jgi:hypothetical protein
MTSLRLQIADHGYLTVNINHLIIAGWAGRDTVAVEHHIAELEELGVRRPKQIPCFYRLSTHLLNTSELIQVPGKCSSGEIEFVLIPSDEGLLVGLGSDHTDRKVESYDITVSKQMCDKPICIQVWQYAQIQAHWDQLVMRTWRTKDGQRELYQQGPVTGLLAPEQLLGKLNEAGQLPPNTAMFCGTLPVLRELGYGDAFEMELHDPVLKRSLHHRYFVDSLPVAE